MLAANYVHPGSDLQSLAVDLGTLPIPSTHLRTNWLFVTTDRDPSSRLLSFSPVWGRRTNSDRTAILFLMCSNDSNDYVLAKVSRLEPASLAADVWCTGPQVSSA